MTGVLILAQGYQNQTHGCSPLCRQSRVTSSQPWINQTPQYVNKSTVTWSQEGVLLTHNSTDTVPQSIVFKIPLNVPNVSNQTVPQSRRAAGCWEKFLFASRRRRRRWGPLEKGYWSDTEEETGAELLLLNAWWPIINCLCGRCWGCCVCTEDRCVAAAARGPHTLCGTREDTAAPADIGCY